jgi:subtilisin family serine protease
MGASVPNRLIVKFKPSVLKANTKGEALRMQADILNSSAMALDLGALTSVNILTGDTGVIRYAAALSPVEAARKLRNVPGVEYAQPDYIMHLFVNRAPAVVEAPSPFAQLLNLTPKADPDYVEAPALPSPAVDDPMLSQVWGLSKIHATDAWKLQRGSRDIVVADIDTGIDYTHPDLVNNLWHNPDASAADKIGYDFANKDPNPYDDQGHGTHTAGTIGATGGNGIGVSGVAQEVSLMSVKFITAAGSGTTSDSVLAIDYAIQHGARVMSNSWGGPADDPDEDNQVLVDAVKRADAADILFVAAAGNDGTNNDTTPMYPAAIDSPNVLAVASTNNSDGRSFFSNYGPKTVHVGAPGSSVLSTLPGGKYGIESGTSMACPHVAGLAALILAQNPKLHATEVKQIIMDTVDQLPSLQGKIATGGRINVEAAIKKAQTM